MPILADYLTIGGVAGSLHLNPRTLRFYDRIGLLSPSVRSEGGYRLYLPQDIERLRFIIRAKTLGLSLEEIRSVLSLADEGLCSSARQRVGEMLARKIQEIDDRVREMQQLREEFARFRKHVDEDDLPVRPYPDCSCLD